MLCPSRAVAQLAQPPVGDTVTYLCGPDGKRLKKVVGTDVTLYLGADPERDPANAWTTYISGDVKRAGGRCMSCIGTT